MEPRIPRQRYVDPLDQVWLGTAARLGLRLRRSPEVNASTDGRGTLTLGSPDTLDPDDCLAQMVLHEICHWLVEGEAAASRQDWGLDNTGDRDVPREQACLRLQAVLAGRHGLRRVLAPTTDFRAFYDALPEDPLDPRHDETAVAATLGLQRSAQPPWAPHLDEALAATARIAREAAAHAASGPEATPTLWTLRDEPPPRHPLGVAGSPVAGRSCGNCAWRHPGRGRVDRCRRHQEARVQAGWPACEGWEAELDCRTCAACCREAYQVVALSPRDPVVALQPALVVRRGRRLELARAGDRCAALDGTAGEGYACTAYEDRPRTCRDFQRGGPHCLTARRRVGLSA